MRHLIPQMIPRDLPPGCETWKVPGALLQCIEIPMMQSVGGSGL
jgi:hypothetical protein